MYSGLDLSVLDTMKSSGDDSKPTDDVGDILIKVHEDLLDIKEKLVSNGQVDITAIQNAIEKTESSIKKQTVKVLNVMNNQVKTLPSLQEQTMYERSPMAETTWDLQVSQGMSPPNPAAMVPRLKDSRIATQASNNQYTFTPAEKHRLKMAQKSMFNPQNEQNRNTMNDNYGLQLPLISDPRGSTSTKTANQKLFLGSTIDPLMPLPAANRKDPQLAPPPITEDEARHGILSLLERGLIPPGAELTLQPPPVKQRLALMHSAEGRRYDRPVIADVTSHNLVGVKLDASVKDDSSRHRSIQGTEAPSIPSPETYKRREVATSKQKSIHMPKTTVPAKTLELQLHPVMRDNYTRPASASDIPSLPPIESPTGFKIIEFFNKNKDHISSTSAKHRPKGDMMRKIVIQLMGRPDPFPIYHLPPAPDIVLTEERSTNTQPGDFPHFLSASDCMMHRDPPPATPNLMADQKSIRHRFPIQHGRVKDTTNEYMAFRQHYCLSWGPIVTITQKLEKVLLDFAVPIAFVNGDKLADLALEFELEIQPSIDDLLSVLVNREDVETIIRTPGQRFRGQNGKKFAATKIQSQYRMYKQRKAYLEYRHRKWAAGVIALTWVMNVKMATMKRQLKVTRVRESEHFKERAKAMAVSWHRIKRSRRVIIHVPSLGYAQRVRDTLSDFGTVQNAQMARLCDIKDPNVEVIYVSPVPVNDECMQYYSKLLSLKQAVDSGNVEDQTEQSEKYKIVVPEAIKSFPTHNMCLATHLKYSPKALKRIRALIHGREAYMVTGMPHIDDLSVADFLNVPILGPEPDVAHLYSTKSGSKRIFHSANAKIPPGEFDIYTFPQLHDSLAQLITDNLDVRTWLFKMDHEFDGRGTAYCHIADHLRCYMWARKECERYGDKWSKKWAQEPVFNKIHSELPNILENHCIPLNKNVYTSWIHFLNAFLSRGGVVEATPPSDSVTCLTTDMLIEPDGKIEILSTADQIHADTPYKCWGLSTPQCSIDPADLNRTCRMIGEAAKARGIVGYFTVDFVTFIHPKTGDQEFWAVDLNLHYNDSTSMNSLVDFMTNGTFNSVDHVYTIPPMTVEKKRQRRRRNQTTDDELPPTLDRYAVYSTKLMHSNLTVVHYSVFFQMCRAHGIGYDVKEKQGTVFTLIDCFNRENIGMLTIGDNLQGALATFARNMSCIHQEISAPNMQGVTNFKNAIEDIETILGTTIQNANEVEDEDDV